MPEHTGSTVSIVDLGGARFKASAYVLDGAPRRVWHASEETGDLVKAERADDVREILAGLVAQAREHAGRVVAYGAGLLRQPRWHDELMPALDRLADESFVLGPQQEGRLLLLAAEHAGGAASHLVDIGGESVQLVTHEDQTKPHENQTKAHEDQTKADEDRTKADVSSWPVGTFAVERRWHLPQGSPLAAYEAAAEQLRATFALRPVAGSRLAIGTGLMEEFLRSLAPLVGVERPDRWCTADLDRAWRFCAQLPRERFAEVLPVKPGFMFGADKAMLIAWVIAGQLGADAAHGTGASVMDGVAWSLLDRLPID